MSQIRYFWQSPRESKTHYSSEKNISVNCLRFKLEQFAILAINTIFEKLASIQNFDAYNLYIVVIIIAADFSLTNIFFPYPF